MKNQTKLLLLVLSMLMSIFSFAQSTYKPALQKGSVMVGGGMSLSFGNFTSEYTNDFDSGEEEAKYSSFSVTSTFGSFVSNGIALGIILDVTSESYKQDQDGSTFKASTTEYSFGPVFRYYAPGGFFVHGDVTFGKTIEKYSFDSDSESDEGNLLKWKVGFGYAFFLNDHVSIEPSMVYRKTQMKHEDEYESNTDKLGEFAIGVGFNIFLHKGSAK